jgi:hypothetical protein
VNEIKIKKNIKKRDGNGKKKNEGLNCKREKKRKKKKRKGCFRTEVNS